MKKGLTKKERNKTTHKKEKTKKACLKNTIFRCHGEVENVSGSVQSEEVLSLSFKQSSSPATHTFIVIFFERNSCYEHL